MAPQAEVTEASKAEMKEKAGFGADAVPGGSGCFGTDIMLEEKVGFGLEAALRGAPEVVLVFGDDILRSGERSKAVAVSLGSTERSILR